MTLYMCIFSWSKTYHALSDSERQIKIPTTVQHECLILGKFDEFDESPVIFQTLTSTNF